MKFEDFEKARREMEDALRKVEEHADPTWKEDALEAVRTTALVLDELICDDVWVVGELRRTREDRALGPVMQRARKNGWIKKTDRVRPSVRSHLSGKPIWESLIRGFDDGILAAASTPPATEPPVRASHIQPELDLG